MKGPTTRWRSSYTADMEAALVVLVIVVTAVAIDTIGRLRERRQRRDVASATPERIVVDLSDRDGGSEDDR